ncbi:hypothetical protein CLIM01_04218 [Colletotrichum limetticola]|uniref:Uncharacterized protein n=1 Tax=Colletotrichum limetticola TaxID=1209924 RepID=A0ABQ9Q423_9PEZI|nr:hypothetical protein CLIM01_04218 [Colletotrichum limetticola]
MHGQGRMSGEHQRRPLVLLFRQL